jgi:DNA glycosylase AlkZ-like
MLSDDQVRWLRLRGQLLVPTTEAARNATQLLHAIGGVQAQEQPAAALAVRARTTGLLAEAVEQARLVERSIIRTWAMRGTLHLLASEDVGWLLALLGPTFMAASSRRRAELGLDADTTDRGVRALRKLLAANGPQTRAQIAERLDAQGIPVAGQALIHLIGYAALAGVVCQGPDHEGKPAYVLLADWADMGKALAPEAAAAELARRYLAAYGPATPEDLATWSGLARGVVRDAWQRISDEVIEVKVAGRATWLLAAHTARLDERPDERPSVRLLPGYDTYLLGYRTRELAVTATHARLVHPGGGVLRPVLLVDGRAAGVWRSTPRKRQLVIVVKPFAELTEAVLTTLTTEAEDVGRFLGRAATLQLAPAD